MTYAAAADVIGTHIRTAGSVATVPFTDIGRGERLTNARRIDYWYLGSGSPYRMGGDETLTDAMRAERVHIRIVVPVTDRSATYSENVEDQLQAIGFDIRKRLYGDANLGGTCTAIDVGHAETGWIDFAGAWARTLDIIVGIDLVEEIPIAL